MNANKLSQIILYVDEMVPDNEIWSFRTNTINANPDIWFTYYRYYTDDEANSDMDYDKLFRYPKEEVFVITDSNDFSYYLGKKGIAFTAYKRSEKEKQFAYSLYCIESISDIEYVTIERMWQRERGIPWLICETDRLIIREQTMDDIDALYELYADSEIKRFTEDLYEDKNQELQYLKDYISNQYRFCEYGIWAVIEKGSGALIGRAGISNRAEYEDAEIGYVIGKDYRKKGYATEACRAILDYAYHELQMKKINAFTLANNVAGIALLNRLGFCKEGIGNIDGKEYELYRISFDLN